jgi:predicted metal-binding protein
MIDRSNLETLFAQHSYDDYKWLNPRDIVVAQWVRMKCVFGCGNYGHNATCPPAVPSVDECRRFFDEYSSAVIFHFHHALADPDDRHKWSRAINLDLLKLERAVFLAGHEKAFLLAMDSCAICADCAETRERCKSPRQARPSPEAMAVDVYTTVRQTGYEINVVKDYTQAMDRYALLLID